MKYLILIHSNPGFLKVWDGMSEAERVEFGRGHRTLNDDLTESGELIVSEALADVSLARRVTVREGRTMTTDGPFAEVKEHLAGFYLVECESIERAIEWAARAPDAAYDEVEVRPVLDLSEWDEWEL
ncbi:MAG: YciI family protein [Propionibacteriales bacterium]|nr:YciI family protein [Propionibacteriales bacterium]